MNRGDRREDIFGVNCGPTWCVGVMNLQGENLGGAGGVDFGFRFPQDGVRYDTQLRPLSAFSWLSS